MLSRVAVTITTKSQKAFHSMDPPFRPAFNVVPSFGLGNLFSASFSYHRFSELSFR